MKLQRAVGGAIMSPLAAGYRMQKALRPVADAFIKPNDRLTSFERLEIYNRQYWFRLIDCFYDDYPGLRAVLGDDKFDKLCKAYLAKYPSTSFTLRNLGQYLERYLAENAQGPLALDMARLEWARTVAFDGDSHPGVTADDLLGQNPAKLRLRLQPHITLLDLRYPADDFLIALKQASTDTLRGEASNAVTTPHHVARKKTLRRPKPGRCFVAVHRQDNAVYYKRLGADEFRILRALQDGATLTRACAHTNHVGDVQRWFGTWARLGWLCRR